jgi:hypothetical protein
VPLKEMYLAAVTVCVWLRFVEVVVVHVVDVGVSSKLQVCIAVDGMK